MHKTLVVINQQTPLIHFQHDQSGATLRATELKPKLDRYIWEKEWKDEFEAGKKFLIGFDPDRPNELHSKFKEGFQALDYSIQILPQAPPRIWTIPNKYPLYFGNMQKEGEEKQQKHFSFTRESIQIIIRSFQAELLEIVKKHIGQLFQVENFGTRQGKGFGSFKVASVDGEKPKLFKPSHYSFEVECGLPNDPSSFKKLFDAIELFYRTLRSGINLKGKNPVDRLYFKSLLFQYAKSEGFTWDKREIRRKLFGSHPKFIDIEATRNDSDGTVQYKGKEPRLYRDMLGLSSSQQWQSYSKASVDKSSKVVDRYKSPITYKPFHTGNGNWKIYIIPTEIPEEMKKQKFTISEGRNSLDLITPDFDLSKYLRFAFGYFKNNGISIEEYVGDHSAAYEVELLEDIYSQLSQQV